MSKNLDRYWELENQLQYLWSIPDEARDYPLINKLNTEQRAIVDSLRESERIQIEDAILTHH